MRVRPRSCCSVAKASDVPARLRLRSFINLATVEADLEAGAIVVFDNERLRIRPLPMQP
jgi:hypothetical protein